MNADEALDKAKVLCQEYGISRSRAHPIASALIDAYFDGRQDEQRDTAAKILRRVGEGK